MTLLVLLIGISPHHWSGRAKRRSRLRLHPRPALPYSVIYSMCRSSAWSWNSFNFAFTRYIRCIACIVAPHHEVDTHRSDLAHHDARIDSKTLSLPTPASSKSRLPKDPIAGGVVGWILLLCLVAGLAYNVYRWRRSYSDKIRDSTKVPFQGYEPRYTWLG